MNNDHYQLVDKALQFINQQQNQQPSLADIAKHCHISEYHFQRIFSEWAGISPKRFLQCLTKEQAIQRLLSGDSLLAVTDHCGLSSSSRLHDLCVTLDAVTPGEIKSGGEGIVFSYGIHPSPFGTCFIATTARGIHQLAFIEDNDAEACLTCLRQQWPKATITKAQTATKALISDIFSPRQQRPTTLKLWIKGSQFQFKVWEALLAIPSGSLSCYSAIAKAIENPKAARAVGSAVASNPVAFLIPCHRVIQSMGALGQYRWGKTRKQAIVGWEAGHQ